MRRIVTFLTLFLCLAVVSNAQDVVRPSVSVVGEADMTISPDQVSFTFEIVTADRDLSKAKQQNDTAAAKTIATARSFNISPDDIQTQRLTITPKYTGDKDPRGSRVLIGYEVTKRVDITLTDLTKIDTFLSRVIDAGVNRIVDVSIENSDYQKYQEQTRAAAVANARDRASAYAKQLGQSIGKAYVIREEDADNPANFGGVGNGWGNGNGTGAGDEGEPSLKVPTAYRSEISFALGKITVSEKIFVTFELLR